MPPRTPRRHILPRARSLAAGANDLADSDTQIATDLVNLYRTLGGGWEVADVTYDTDDVLRQTIGTP